MTRATRRLATAMLVASAGCVADPLPIGEPDISAPLEGIVVDPAPARMARLSAAQYRNAVRDLLGPEVVLPSALEPDMPIDGLAAVGNAVNSISKRGVEQYVDAAHGLAAQAVASPAVLARILPCSPSGASDAACLEQVVHAIGRRAWRRPLTDEEAAPILAIGNKAMKTLKKFDAGVELSLAALLSSPRFLYRIEAGEPAPDGGRRYTGYEMASRLSFLLWNTAPDEALLEAAAAGTLTDDAGLAAEVTRMLTDERLRHGVLAFFTDWLSLGELDQLAKDPTIFEHFAPELGAAAREETLRVIGQQLIDRDSDYRALFTTRETWVNPRLAALYEVPAPPLDEAGFGPVTLPADGARAGILGHVSFLALHAHPVSSSATRRGIFLRQRLLCQTLPPPPADVNTALPEPKPGLLTLRERLEEHRKNPGCASCHEVMDPPGYGLESFDGIGRFRLTDNGGAVDPSGDLDGVPFDGARSLFDAVAHHPELVPCFVTSMARYATGRDVTPGEAAQHEALVGSFEASGRRVRRLLFDIATSPGFRRVAEVTP